DVGDMETSMWRSYYDHRPFPLFTELTVLLRRQYHAPFWRACLGAVYAARAAVVFQRGHNRSEYLLALPALESYYKLIQKGSTTSFNSEKAAAIELEWWIIHRERSAHQPDDLENALAKLQEVIFNQPSECFREHAQLRARAMLIRDERAAGEGVSQDDWKR